MLLYYKQHTENLVALHRNALAFWCLKVKKLYSSIILPGSLTGMELKMIRSENLQEIKCQSKLHTLTQLRAQSQCWRNIGTYCQIVYFANTEFIQDNGESSIVQHHSRPCIDILKEIPLVDCQYSSSIVQHHVQHHVQQYSSIILHRYTIFQHHVQQFLYIPAPIYLFFWRYLWWTAS